MPRRRAPFSRQCFRKAPALCLVGVLVLAGDGNLCAKLSGQQSSFGFFAAALAGDDDEGHHSKHPASVDNAGKGSGSSGEHGPHSTGAGTGHTKGTDGKHNATPHTDGIPLGSHQASVSYDASRNMMKLHVPLGGHHESQSVFQAGHLGMAANVGGHLPDPQGKVATETYIRSITESKEGQTVLTLDRSVTPVAARYQNSMFERSEATTVMAKTSVPIGGTLIFAERGACGRRGSGVD